MKLEVIIRKEVNIIVSSEEIRVLKPRIRVKIAELDKKQVDIAKQLGVKQQRLSNWVNGTGFPNLNEAFKLARYFECSVDELWDYKED